MKIAFVVPIALQNPDPAIKNRWGVWGSEISSLYVIKELARRGHEVTVFSFDSKKEKEEEIEGVYFKRYPPSRRNASSKNFIFIKRKLFRHYDIIHFYGLVMFRYSYVVKILNMFNDVKTVVTLNYYSNICPKGSAMKNYDICKRCNFIDLLKCSRRFDRALKIEIYRHLSFLNDAYIVLSRNSKKVFEMFGFPKRKLHVIPNIIPRINYKNRKSDGKTLIYTGRLDATKGVDILLKALSIVKEKNENFRCYIVGEGSEMKNLKALVEHLKISDKVYFTGLVDHEHLEEYYLRSDIFVFPVRWLEPFGRSLLEAMAYGLPIIASEAVDQEIIKDAAITFKVNDYHDLADKIVYLLSNEDAREKISKAGREQVKNFYPEKVIPKLEQVYKKIVYKF